MTFGIKHRSPAEPAILAQGFRPFFLLAGLWAVVALPVSIAMMQGYVELPIAIDPVSWHVHEMLFGYTVAVIAGFLLTAIPNWTGHLPLRGRRLLGLVALWVAGRLAMGMSAWLGPWLAAAVDLAFLATLAAVATREIVAGRNWRNLPIIGAVTLLLVFNALTHAEMIDLVATEGLGARLAIAATVCLIALVGGRIVPSFTRNWLVKQAAAGVPQSFGWFDRATLAATAVALVIWAVMPEGRGTGGLAALAALTNFARLARWRGYATLREPLVWVLHLGYLWIPVGLALIATSHWWSALPQSGAMHALTVGAIGTMTVAVMSRATLGHTGRELRAGAGLTVAYVLISAAALGRIAAAVWDGLHEPLLTAAAVAWVTAFALFVVLCGSMLVHRRSDGTAG